MEKPMVSYCLISYNQENFIRDAIESALKQDYHPLEIIISDDNSSDRTFEIAEQVVTEYKGTHSVILNQNKRNLGIREHCNKLFYEISTGKYIFLAAGDDVSKENRVSEYMRYFIRNPEIMSISCLSQEVDEELTPIKSNDEWNGSFSIYTIDDYIRFRDFIINSGDSRALKRDVIELFPPLKYPDAEDISLFYRSLLIGNCGYIREPLVMRRHHSNNVSDRNIKDYEPLRKQFIEDTEYGKEKGYISDSMYEKCLNKVEHIIEFFDLYWGCAYKTPKVFFYRTLRKIFHVTKI